MKKRKLYLILALFLLILIVVVASVPRVTAVDRLTFEELENGACPLLWNEYLLQSEGRAMVPVEEAEIVTVSSIWGSVEYCILPCIYSHVETVPENGQALWCIRLCMVTVCSDPSSLTSYFPKIGVENVNVFAQEGTHTLLSDKVDVDPAGSFDGSTGHVQIVDIPDCSVTPSVGVRLYAGTAMSAQESNQEDKACFSWDFDIFMLGKLIRSYRDFTVEYDYIYNAS